MAELRDRVYRAACLTLLFAVLVVFIIKTTEVFIGFEKIEVSVDVAKSGGHYTVTVQYYNVGSVSATIDSVFLNGIPTTDTWTFGTIKLDGDLETLPSLCETGVPKSGTISFPEGIMDSNGNALSSRTTLEITLHTTRGISYPASVELP